MVLVTIFCLKWKVQKILLIMFSKSQVLGYAEPGNATPDLNGSDAMSKLKSYHH